MKHTSTALCLFLFFVSSVGCDGIPPEPIPSQPPSKIVAKKVAKKVIKKAKKKEAKLIKKKFAYSPFVLQLQTTGIFKSISFKDVGAQLNDSKSNVMYETIAESLSQAVTREMALGMQSQVVYDKSNLNPNNHLACGSDRIYVDFWKSQNPDRWGFSLWSGCGEDDNFAWKEVEYTPSKTKDSTEDVAPLAKSIVAVLKAAKSKNCYQKTC